MTSGVYEIVNTVNGKRYVGSAMNPKERRSRHFSRLRRGEHPNAHLQRSFDKHGESAFEFIVVLECSIDDLIAQEQERIDSYDFNELYNLSPIAGSSLGTKRSAEFCVNNSAIKMGNQYLLGYKHTEKAKTKVSAAMMGNQHALGHAVGDETRAKISEAASNPSPETRAKMSAAQTGNQNGLGNRSNLGRMMSDETRAKMSAAAKKRWATSGGTR